MIRLIPVSIIALVAACGRAPDDSPPIAGLPTEARQAIFSPLGPDAEREGFIYSNPGQPGPFVMRIRELPGSIVPPHTHDFDENITVVEGTWYFAIGAEYDPAKLRKLPTGSYVFIPKGTPMFGYAPDGATVQVHGDGPFNQAWLGRAVSLEPEIFLGSEGALPSSFTFRKGETVSTPRGPGEVLQGYAIGNLVQYVIHSADKGIFMVDERDMKRLPTERR